MKDKSNLSGILTSRSETGIDINFAGSARKQLKTADLQSLTQMKKSMMTEGLYNAISTQILAKTAGVSFGFKKDVSKKEQMIFW